MRKEMIEIIRETDDGYEIVTNRQVIRMGIDQNRRCCEDFGYLMSNDNISEFEGHYLIDIKVVDEFLNVKDIKHYVNANTMFVNFETSNGTLQFVSYNEHNGYYAHAAYICCLAFNEHTFL